MLPYNYSKTLHLLTERHLTTTLVLMSKQTNHFVRGNIIPALLIQSSKSHWLKNHITYHVNLFIQPLISCTVLLKIISKVRFAELYVHTYAKGVCESVCVCAFTIKRILQEWSRLQW